MNGLLSNPYTALGAGLLAHSGPSLNPADVGLGRGFQQGLLNLQGMQAAQLQRQLLSERINARRQQLSMQQAQMAQQEQERQRAELARRQMMEAAQSGDPRQMGQALLGAGQYAPAMGLLFPQDGDQWSAPYVDNSTGKPILVQRNERTGALKAVGSGGVTVQNLIGGEKPLEARMPTSQEAQAAGIPPGRIGDYIVEGGKLKVRPERGETQEEKERRKRAETLGNVEDALKSYEILIAKHGTEFAPGPAKREMETARTQLLLELKNLYELGALQAPDLVLMENILADPTTIGANIGGLLTGGANVQNYLAQLDKIRERLAMAKRRAGLIGSPAESTGQTEAPGPDWPRRIIGGRTYFQNPADGNWYTE